MKRWFMVMTLPLLVGGCVNGSLQALCSATATDRDRLAAVAADEGTDNVVSAAQPFISKVDAACSG